ncbi:MAG: glycoside hydrolase family 88 protein, partial [Clostridiales bacterium]|nr:glycoside hydrolase family 88 protein [Clostridiales bacterium]
GLFLTRKITALVLAGIMVFGAAGTYSGAEENISEEVVEENEIQEETAEEEIAGESEVQEETAKEEAAGEAETQEETAEEEAEVQEETSEKEVSEESDIQEETAGAESADSEEQEEITEGETVENSEIELEEIIITDDKAGIEASPFNMADLAGSDETEEEYSYRALLSEYQKSAYDKVLEEISVDDIDDENERLILDFTISGELTGSSDLANVIWAVYRDNPDYFWFNTTTIRAGSAYNSSADTTEIVYYLYTLGTKAEIEEYMTTISEIEEEVVSACSVLKNEYEKIKYVHDYVCDAADYDYDTSSYYTSTGKILSGNPFSPVGVLVDGSAVCQGYTLAVKLLCDDVGVNSLYQSGTAGTVSHAWSWVEMEDSLWYGLDSTWDGQTSETIDTYFLLGTDSFNLRHTYTNSFGITISAENYEYDEISEERDKMALLINNMTADDDPTDGSPWNKESPSSFKWSYINGCMVSALMALSEGTGDETYSDFADTYMSAFISDSPASSSKGYISASFSISSYALDDLNSGKALIELIAAGSGNSTKYTNAVSETLYTNILKYMLSHKTTAEGNLWHKNAYPYQVWLDGIYMETPFWLEYELEIGENADDFIEAAEHVTTQISNVYDKLRDSETGLYYHGYDAQADPESENYDTSSAMSWALNTTGNNTGASSEFWLRGTGWYAMALVDNIELLKEGEEKFGIDLTSEIYSLTTYYTELMDALIEYRDSETGLWYQVIDKPQGDYNYTETSGSAAIAYALMKGANSGIVQSSYYDTGYDVFLSLCGEKLLYTDDSKTDVTLNDICGVAGLAGPSSGKTSSSATGGYAYKTRDGSYKYYVSEATVTDDAKGAAPLIMAYNQVLLNESGKTTDYTPAEEPTESTTETTTVTTTQTTTVSAETTPKAAAATSKA